MGIVARVVVAAAAAAAAAAATTTTTTATTAAAMATCVRLVSVLERGSEAYALSALSAATSIFSLLQTSRRYWRLIKADALCAHRLLQKSKDAIFVFKRNQNSKKEPRCPRFLGNFSTIV